MSRDLDAALDDMRAALARADGTGSSGTKVLSGATEIDLGSGLGYHEVEYLVTAKYSFDFELKSVKSVDWDAKTDRETRAQLQPVIEKKLRAEIARNTRDLVDMLTEKL